MHQPAYRLNTRKIIRVLAGFSLLASWLLFFVMVRWNLQHRFPPGLRILIVLVSIIGGVAFLVYLSYRIAARSRLMPAGEQRPSTVRDHGLAELRTPPRSGTTEQQEFALLTPQAATIRRNQLVYLPLTFVAIGVLAWFLTIGRLDTAPPGANLVFAFVALTAAVLYIVLVSYAAMWRERTFVLEGVILHEKVSGVSIDISKVVRLESRRDGLRLVARGRARDLFIPAETEGYPRLVAKVYRIFLAGHEKPPGDSGEGHYLRQLAGLFSHTVSRKDQITVSSPSALEKFAAGLSLFLLWMIFLILLIQYSLGDSPSAAPNLHFARQLAMGALCVLLLWLGLRRLRNRIEISPGIGEISITSFVASHKLKPAAVGIRRARVLLLQGVAGIPVPSVSVRSYVCAIQGNRIYRLGPYSEDETAVHEAAAAFADLLRVPLQVEPSSAEASSNESLPWAVGHEFVLTTLALVTGILIALFSHFFGD
ncbi:MAG: hypothetical protein ACOY5B_05015 [Spirochaetota bacterium]